MLRRLCMFVCIVAFSFGGKAIAAPRTFAISFVSTKLPHGAIGDDAGVSVAGGRYVRLTASGSVELASYGACGRSIGPNGCNAAMSFSRVAPNAPTGSLIIAFVDAAGRPVTAWAEAGDAAFVVVPARASRMLLRVNGATGRESGRFRVAADVVMTGGGGTGTTTGGVHRFATQRQVATSESFTRTSAQHLLRRFGFSDTPANVTALYQGGATAWLTAQLNPAGINDSALATYMDPIPMYQGTIADNGVPNIVQDRIIQREVSSQRQLLEKVTLHWLEHFAVSEDKVNDIGAMAHYEDTVRADALGNFAKLVTDVAKEPAMLYWLDNNYNNGANASSSPPNENFGRELMQLYTVGETELNQDGSNVVDANGIPVPNYGEPDVKTMALALTGFQVDSPYPEPTATDIRGIDSVAFNVHSHPNTSSYVFFPSTEGVGPSQVRVIDPGNATIVDQCVSMLANLPTTAPFQVTEMLQRFVTEDPSPGYISRISKVWTANVNDPNQIAKVVQAIATDPEFYTSQHSMVKEPIEYAADAVRALNGSAASPVTSSDATPWDQLRNDESNMAEVHYYPPSVFSFYRPGQKESLVTNSELLSRWQNAVDVANSARVTTTCTTCSINENLSAFSTMTPTQITAYLLDALADGGSPELQALVQNYLNGNHTDYSGAIWIVLTSPEYEVN